MRTDDAVTAIGFWIGTLLPVAYLPVLLLGIDSVLTLAAFFGLVTVNVLALVVGHEYSGSRA
ncbi:hypothetical protein D8Y22_04310 [Salinadaptatus halalkaliphilus]|uniref:Uncharacterized protein n=1 Tax=Salinadaptatus halalkaliphilus TaxID=2419781 RepID=A0A4S3TU28_9EURY|nr:hypothetical protein [Salinadaptatus halalkaliphilus]THE66148.1 hypothetical protein D8Y22_04310 [Salinadaptatus halalkaliphilus]